MSAFASARRAAVPQPPRNQIDGTPRPILGVLNDLAAYLPSEGIAVYIAIIAFGSGLNSAAVPWIAVAAAILLNGIVTVVVYRALISAADRPGAARLSLLVIVTTFLSMVYIASLEGNPFQVSLGWNLIWPGIVAIVLVAVMPFLAPVLGLRRRELDTD
ncbi:hypothetical protein JF66_11575 [Cryobacterium sp. MLB-32]|uniref:hypothetical protein n=1 Tax=Cryobacterium sp. MLB-32 TaxID=1529318 RepID=UPI0004E638D8|nr:hypothetical protein [Cryobacterium sp. MLB-32]KFF59413.1 hypothetical protein JF66_11575 [Cryobacterium sp. MLB-32]